jgi:hypothetical protein
VHSWSTFDARTNHEHTWIHKIHHCLDLGEAITFPFIIFFVTSHGLHPNVIFPRTPKSRVPKFSRLRLSPLWTPILFVNLRLRGYSSHICSLHQKLSNDMWHTLCMHITCGFFCHNLCCKYLNGSCEPILDIYVSRDFQRYK